MRCVVIEPYFDKEILRIRQVGDIVEVDSETFKRLTGENVFGKTYISKASSQGMKKGKKVS